MSRYNMLFLSFMLLFTAACSSDVFLVHNGNIPSAEKIAQVSVGQTKEEVADILGTPSSVANFDDNTWIYMSSTVKKVAFFRPKIMDRDILTIRFDKQGKVAKIDQLNQKDGKTIDIDTEQTEVEEEDVGFFKKYFGGVGAYMPIGPSKEH